MRYLKDMMTMLAWIGIILIAIGLWFIAGMTIIDITWTPDQLHIQSQNYGWPFYILGVIIASICGLAGKPRFIWQALSISGALCLILVIIGSAAEMNHIHYPDDFILSDLIIKLFFIAVSITAGLLIRNLRAKQKRLSDSQVVVNSL
jgi:hypothetical protein